MCYSDDHLQHPLSPTRQTYPKPEYEYFISVGSEKYDDLDEAIETANKYALDDITNCRFEDMQPITVKKYYKDGGYIDTVHIADPKQIAVTGFELYIELHKLESSQFGRTSDTQVRINEIKKELTKIIEL